jgi:hypothetical protein
MCLENKSYDVVTSHAIFRGPYPVTPTLTRETNPYTKRPIDAWVVHQKLTNRYGVASSAEHFRGAADSEIIAGGINQKGDRGISLVREAHTFYWGFAGTPTQMTDEARKVFVNAIMYIKQFDGEKQTVRRGVFARSSLRQIVRGSGFFRSQFNLDHYFAPEAVAKCGSDAARYRDYFEPNIDYVYVPAGHSGFRVDEEAKQLGIPNYDVRLLDRCVAMLEANDNPALARTLLERYTGESCPTPPAWRAWLTMSRDKLFFLDGHGYRFFTDAPGAPPAKWQMDEALAELKVAEPNNNEPVATGTTIVSRYARSGVATAYAGDVVTLVVRIRVAEPWHTYAKVPDGSAMKATVIDVKLPNGLRFVGDWKVPTAKLSGEAGTTIYEGDQLFTRDVLVTTKAGSLAVAGNIQFQACDPERCQPPRTEPVNLRMQISDR